MTSKEALNRLLVTKIYEDEDRLEYFNIIKKDLEVLEILKNKAVDIHLIKDIMKAYRKYNVYPCDNLTEDEFNKIKEWLENE